MILSVSRRTDVPNYHSDWFFNRLRQGFLCVRNPMNPHQVSRVGLSPEVVDCIVFWTKNPAPMLERLGELKGYEYYFQFTLTGYGADMEPGIPDKRKVMIPTFRRLSELAGKERVIWRYDPILLNDRYTPDYHLKAFGEIADSLRDHTDRAVISFLDFYAKISQNTEGMHIRKLSGGEMTDIAAGMAGIARRNHMEIETCAEQAGLSASGIRHGCCIDRGLIEKLTGCRLKVGKDKNQRMECGCAESVEAGAYDTCANGCRYCYANRDESRTKANMKRCDAGSPLLCGTLEAEDRVTDRRMKKLREEQLGFLEGI